VSVNTMNFPTGMNPGTGMHYNKIAAQMQAYLNNPQQRGRSPSPFPGRQRGTSPSPFPGAVGNVAAQVVQFGAQKIGVNPMIVNEVGGVARDIMRRVLS